MPSVVSGRGTALFWGVVSSCPVGFAHSGRMLAIGPSMRADGKHCLTVIAFTMEGSIAISAFGFRCVATRAASSATPLQFAGMLAGMLSLLGMSLLSALGLMQPGSGGGGSGSGGGGSGKGRGTKRQEEADAAEGEIVLRLRGTSLSGEALAYYNKETPHHLCQRSLTYTRTPKGTAGTPIGRPAVDRGRRSRGGCP